MARKKRSRKRSTTSVVRQAQPAKRAAVVAEPQEEESSSNVNFAAEYHYVLNDLRRFGILAVAMFVTLIVLALILG